MKSKSLSQSILTIIVLGTAYKILDAGARAYLSLLEYVTQELGPTFLYFKLGLTFLYSKYRS